MTFDVPSEACDLVMGWEHPQYADGGPCHECAFRSGTQANLTPHTVALARLCVEGFREFECHVHPHRCRGFVAAINLRGVPRTQAGKKWAEVNGLACDVLQDAIDFGRRADEAVR